MEIPTTRQQETFKEGGDTMDSRRQRTILSMVLFKIKEILNTNGRIKTNVMICLVK